MRTIYLAVFCLLPALAWPLEFRGVEIGETCRHAAQVESSLGTRPRYAIESMIENGIVAFEDESIAGQHAQFLYSCTKISGIISRYSIDIRTRDESRAWEIYAAAKAAAVLRLGIPPADSETPEATEKLRQLRSKGLTWTYAFATWSAIEHQSVVLTIEKYPDGGEWSISTIISEDNRESPNKSLERTREG